MTACMVVCCFVFSGPEVFAQRDQVPTDEAIIKQGESLFKDWACKPDLWNDPKHYTKAKGKIFQF